MTVTQGGPNTPWVLEIANGGPDTVSLVADSRLLWFEVKAPGRKAELCRLPEPLWPTEPDAGQVVKLQPGEGVRHRFDPRLLCFSSDGQHALVPGAQISPRFGWPAPVVKTKKVASKKSKAAPTPEAPSVLEHLDAQGKVTEHQSLLEADTFALTSDYARWSKVGLPPAPASATEAPSTQGASDSASKPSATEEDAPPPVFTLKVSQGSDTTYGRSAMVTVTVTNRSRKSQKLFVRRELVTFAVQGPRGSVLCNTAPEERTPDTQAFRTVGAGQAVSLASRLTELCPKGTFASPGLYLVQARFDANADGRAQGLKAFTGVMTSDEPALIRVHKPEDLNWAPPAMKRASRAGDEGAAATASAGAATPPSSTTPAVEAPPPVPSASATGLPQGSDGPKP